MKVPFVNFSAAWAKHKRRLGANLEGLDRFFSSGQYINGPAVDKLEQELAQWTGAPLVHACANGTDALWLALHSLGLPRGAKVGVPAFGFVSAAEVVAHGDFQLVFYPVDLQTFNLSAECLDTTEGMEELDALVVVHLFGQLAPIQTILDWAEAHQVQVIEDAAQALGARTGKAGPTAGTFAPLGTTSFFPTKNLGGYGDGGAVFCHSEEQYHKMRVLSRHGAEKKYHYQSLGINSRLDALQALLLSNKLPDLPAELEHRQAHARRYQERLQGLEGLALPQGKGPEHTFNAFTLKVLNGQRDALRSYLKSRGIDTMVYYPGLISDSPVYRAGKLLKGVEENRGLCEEVLSLPVHWGISKEQVDFVVLEINNFWQKQNL